MSSITDGVITGGFGRCMRSLSTIWFGSWIVKVNRSPILLCVKLKTFSPFSAVYVSISCRQQAKQSSPHVPFSSHVLAGLFSGSSPWSSPCWTRLEIYQQSNFFSHDPEFMAIGKGWNVDRPLNCELCL